MGRSAISPRLPVGRRGRSTRAARGWCASRICVLERPISRGASGIRPGTAANWWATSSTVDVCSPDGGAASRWASACPPRLAGGKAPEVQLDGDPRRGEARHRARGPVDRPRRSVARSGYERLQLPVRVGPVPRGIGAVGRSSPHPGGARRVGRLARPGTMRPGRWEWRVRRRAPSVSRAWRRRTRQGCRGRPTGKGAGRRSRGRRSRAGAGPAHTSARATRGCREAPSSSFGPRCARDCARCIPRGLRTPTRTASWPTRIWPRYRPNGS